MIYRIAESEEWLSTLRCGQFASADLAQEGFIHCSEKQQILRTAEKYYAGKTDLRLLEIDDILMGEKVRRESSGERGEYFPHVYAPIPMTAILRHFDFRVEDAEIDTDIPRRFLLPPAL